MSTVETEGGSLGGEKRAREGPKRPQGIARTARTRSYGDRREEQNRTRLTELPHAVIRRQQRARRRPEPPQRREVPRQAREPFPRGRVARVAQRERVRDERGQLRRQSMPRAREARLERLAVAIAVVQRGRGAALGTPTIAHVGTPPAAASPPLAPRRAHRDVDVVRVPGPDLDAAADRRGPRRLEQTHQRALISGRQPSVAEHLRPGRRDVPQRAVPPHLRSLQRLELAVVVRAGGDERVDDAVGAVHELGRGEIERVGATRPAQRGEQRVVVRAQVERGESAVRRRCDRRAARGERERRRRRRRRRLLAVVLARGVRSHLLGVVARGRISREAPSRAVRRRVREDAPRAAVRVGRVEVEHALSRLRRGAAKGERERGRREGGRASVGWIDVRVDDGTGCRGARTRGLLTDRSICPSRAPREHRLRETGTDAYEVPALGVRVARETRLRVRHDRPAAARGREWNEASI